MNWMTTVNNRGVDANVGSDVTIRPWLATAQKYLILGFERLGDWQERMEQRRRLMTMDERMLHDIGLCREDAINEAVKPFWRV
ncbi:MAG: DUF1127 domain-containing protein [Rhodospirillales bacterium]|nr:DUF1127 domain-containing protein [Rhodospirillales bacterium]